MENEELRIKPVVILQSGSMSKEDIKRLRANGFCVVESKTPAAVRFMDPPPQNSYTVQERAAIELARTLLHDGKVGGYVMRQAIGSMYADILLRGNALERVLPVERKSGGD